MTYSFSVVDADGRLHVDNPKMRAYAYMAQLQAQGRETALIVDNGEFTVGSRGLQTLTFAPEN